MSIEDKLGLIVESKPIADTLKSIFAAQWDSLVPPAIDRVPYKTVFHTTYENYAGSVAISGVALTGKTLTKTPHHQSYPRYTLFLAMVRRDNVVFLENI